ncbi:MAG: DivIVA domain-containing protein [Nitrospiraceae bacterium]|nr:DivIVA domain-containing protein [Nitrospiraceae bacterium]
MNISPNDILDKEFHNRFRGYDSDEVDNFLERVAEAMTSLVKERNALKDQLVACNAQLADLRKREEDLHKALTSAQKLSEEMKSQAKRDCELILEKARLDAEHIVADAHQEAIELEGRIRGLKRIQRETIFKIRSTLEGYLQLLDGEVLPPKGIEQAMRLTASEIETIQEAPEEADKKETTEVLEGDATS